MFSSIVVAVDGSPSSLHALGEAIDLAHAQNATLTIMAVAPPVPPLVPVAGADPRAIQESAGQWGTDILADAVAGVPDDVEVHTVLRTGHPAHEIVQELATGNYDLIVLGSRGRGAARSGIGGSVNGAVHFHTHISMLSIPVPGEQRAH